MQRIHAYRHEQLTADSAPQFMLWIVTAAAGISMAVTDIRGRTLALQAWKPDPADGDSVDFARQVLYGDLVYGFSYAKVTCAFAGPNVSLIPRRLFEAESLPAYFQILLPDGLYAYGYDELNAVDARLIYAEDINLYNLCRQRFPDAVLAHSATAMIRQWRTMAGQLEQSIFLNFRHQLAQFSVFERQNLVFFNAFSCSSPADLLYYTLLVYHQFQLRPQIHTLHFSGSLTAEDPFYSILFQHFQSLKPVNPEEELFPNAAPSRHFWWELSALMS